MEEWLLMEELPIIEIIPRLLNFELKQHFVTIPEQMLTVVVDNLVMLQGIITDDETRVYN